MIDRRTFGIGAAMLPLGAGEAAAQSQAGSYRPACIKRGTQLIAWRYLAGDELVFIAVSITATPGIIDAATHSIDASGCGGPVRSVRDPRYEGVVYYYLYDQTTGWKFYRSLVVFLRGTELRNRAVLRTVLRRLRNLISELPKERHVG